MPGCVLVLAEQREGELDAITFELLAKGRELADQLGVELKALILGHQLEPQTKTLTGSGADHVLVADDIPLKDYNPAIYSRVICDTIKTVRPELFILGHFFLGIEMGPSVATRLGATLISNCVDMELADGKVVVTRPAYSGTVHIKMEVTGARPYIISFQKGVLPRKALPARPARVSAVPVATGGLAILSRVIGLRRVAAGEVDLAKADVIVSLGRGIGSRENVQLGKDLAAALGGAVGCSRHLADSGWLPPECHVGMEGKTVTPKVYLACGISGASHHVGGIRDSDLIIAINTDPSAPIFNVAHYGIIGDVREIMPALTDAARRSPKLARRRGKK
ncbi:MAG: electron transfer flavoprotein subunit alpha/FixB family protein [Chloroflexota bacterium]